MRTAAAALVLVASFASQRPATLTVLRVSPVGTAAPTTEVTVAFDRPVAGSLDRTIDARALFEISPAVAGTVEWRDPITLRFRPASPLTPNTSYTVTIANRFEAMDGSRLDAPYRFKFQVSGPHILTGSPVSAHRVPLYLQPRTKFEIVASSAVDLARLSRTSSLEFGDSCDVRLTIALRAISQRPVAANDPYEYRAGPRWSRDPVADPMRRVVALVSDQPMPAGCRGELVTPSILDAEGIAPYHRWRFRTAGAFTLLGPRCGYGASCPTGPLILLFSTPVRGSAVQRHLQVQPALQLTLRDTSEEQAQWLIEARWKPRTEYTVTIDPGLTDMFGQALGGERRATFTTTGFAASVTHVQGRAVVERNAFRTIPVTHINVDTLDAWTAPVPDSLTARFARAPYWGINELLPLLDTTAGRRRIRVTNEQDRRMVTGIRVPAFDARRTGSPVFTLLRIKGPNQPRIGFFNNSLLLAQVTNLGVHAKIGAQEGEVWVTALDKGLAVPGAMVTLLDAKGRQRAAARTDASGLVRFASFSPVPDDTLTDEQRYDAGFDGYVDVVLGDDRAIVPVNRTNYELSPWRFRIDAAWGNEREPAAGAVFTERGIYRPGEPVYAKAIVRTGPLGALRAPAAGDSLRWIFTDREEGTLRDTTAALSRFGTAHQELRLPAGVALGTYQVAVQIRQGGQWRELTRTSYRVAEYRPPEFLVKVTAPTAPQYAGDSVTAAIEARYLFGAPMSRAAVSWTVQQTPVDPWELTIPGTTGYTFGESTWWWDNEGDAVARPTVIASGVDTLDGAGAAAVRVALAAPPKSRPARASFSATVTDVNRQTVTDAAALMVHPAAFYIGAKPQGESYFWIAGTPRQVAVIAVRPDGQRVPGVAIRGTVVRREWHRVERVRDGATDVSGEWVSDTVSHCALTSSAEPVSCNFTPPEGGVYVVTFRATDGSGREAATSLIRWAAGPGFVPWYDEHQFKMDVIADRDRYTVGDTASLLFAVPFTDAEAWVTVEREGILERRRLRITAGSTTLKLPITEAFAPNAYVSMLVARGRTAAPGEPDDPGRPTIRVGYAEIRVTPEVKRLQVALEPAATEYRPGDTARVAVQVRDAAGSGQRSEVTLWAVDEGVLALTGYATPDPIDLLYRRRGLGVQLASNLTTVAEQVARLDGITVSGIQIKGETEPGGGGGRDVSGVLRSQFRPTAFFLASVVTDANGRAVAAAKLPDNLTTFRIMAVAVTAGDRYGQGQSPLLVTRPLLARPALPRFLRRGDQFTAGVVVNQRAGGALTVRVEATATGVELREPGVKTATLAAGRGSEVRFALRDTTADTARLRFYVTDGTNEDAVETRLAVKPAFHPRAHTVAGTLRDSATASFALPAGIDPDRSRLELTFGTSPLALMRGAFSRLRVYPYYCTEQLTSSVLPLIALLRAQEAGARGLRLPADARGQIETAVATILRRQRGDGGIGLWSADDWTTPWLSVYAGTALIEARQLGVVVNDSAMARLATYVRTHLHGSEALLAPVASWYGSLQTRLADRVAAVDFLSRLGQPDIAAENDLLRLAAQLAWEDRARLAQVVARRGAQNAARRLLEPAWREIKVEGRRAVLPDEAVRRFYFFSSRRPAATLLLATLAVDSAHALIGPLVETLSDHGRALHPWNTQDFGSVVTALAAFEAQQRGAGARGVRLAAAGRTLIEGTAGTVRDSTLPLTGLLGPARGADRPLEIRLTANQPGPAVYYYLTVSEVPLERPVTPGDAGIAVERWYEDYTTGRPVSSVTEGDLVRVRLRITAPAERQFVVVDDALPAGLEAVDLSLRTVGGLPGPGTGLARPNEVDDESDASDDTEGFNWYYGRWDAGWWSPFDHRELRDDRVVYVATVLWRGTYTASYVARATTPGTFVLPPVHVEEMYNPAVNGRSSGGTFVVTTK